MLDQTRIVTKGQSLVIWINAAMFVAVNVERLSPNAPYGKLANYTEVHVAPFKTIVNKLDDIKPKTTQQIIERASKNTSLTNGNNRHSIHYDTSSPIAQPIIPKPITKIYTKARGLESLIQDLQKNNSKLFPFRVISSKWEDSQMSDLYLTKHNLPETMDTSQVYQIRTYDLREFYVNIKVLSDEECFPKNHYPTIEMNDILLNRLCLKPFERISLKPRTTALNTIDRIELAPNKAADLCRTRDIEHLFKQYIRDNASMDPVLINQHQIFKLQSDVFVTVNLFPETLKYGCVDVSCLRRCTISCLDQTKDIAKLGPVATKPTIQITSGLQPSASFINLTGNISGHEYVELNKFEGIIEDLLDKIKINLCLDDRNTYRKIGNSIIVGK